MKADIPPPASANIYANIALIIPSKPINSKLACKIMQVSINEHSTPNIFKCSLFNFFYLVR